MQQTTQTDDTFTCNFVALRVNDVTQAITVKPMQNGHSKIDKTNVLMTNGGLMKVESIAECAPLSILQYF